MVHGPVPVKSTLIRADLTGTGPWTIYWSDGVTQTTNANPAVRPVSPSITTAYWVGGLTDANCDAVGLDLSPGTTVTINVISRPTAKVSLVGLSPICDGQSSVVRVELTGAPPWNVHWSDGHNDTVFATPFDRTVFPGATTTYSVQNLDDSNCVAIASSDLTGSATVVVNPRPTAVVSSVGSTNICRGESATIRVDLTGTGPWTIQWSDNVTDTTNGSPAFRTVTPSTTTSYWVGGLNDSKCAAVGLDLSLEKIVTIVVNPLPNPPTNPVNATNCAGVLPNPDR